MFNVTSNGFDIQQTKSSAKIFDQSSNWEITLKELTIEEIEKKRNNLSIKKASQNEDIATIIFIFIFIYFFRIICVKVLILCSNHQSFPIP